MTWLIRGRLFASLWKIVCSVFRMYQKIKFTCSLPHAFWSGLHRRMEGLAVQVLDRKLMVQGLASAT